MREGGLCIHPFFYKSKFHFSIISHHSNKMRSPPLANLILVVSLGLFFNLLTISFAEIPACNPADQAVLLQLKEKIKSPNPGIGDLSDWQADSNCCFWPFIGCNGQGPSYGRVNGVTISRGSGLVGQIPEVIGNLPYLEEIMFMDEPKLTGPLPKSLSKLKHLELLYLGNNGLTGSIQAFLGNLKRLRGVDISSNHFTGSIPATLSNLPKLKSFNVSFNQLCGPIPAGLSKFSKSSFAKNKCLCGTPLPPCK